MTNSVPFSFESHDDDDTEYLPDAYVSFHEKIGILLIDEAIKRVNEVFAEDDALKSVNIFCIDDDDTLALIKCRQDGTFKYLWAGSEKF